jgi:CDP-paratose 2-epimerase
MGGGPANAISLLEVVDLIGQLGMPPDVRHAKERPGDQRYYVANTSRFAAATGWRPQVEAREGISRLHRWLAEERTARLPRAAVAS